MQIVIDYQGKEYASKIDDKVTKDEMVGYIKQDLKHLGYLAIDLDEGGTLILGKEAANNCVIVVYST